MPKISAIFWSGPAGKPFKGTRLESVLSAFSQNNIDYSFYGIGKNNVSNTVAKHHLYRAPMIINSMLHKACEPIGRSSAGRHYGGKWLGHMAIKHGCCGHEIDAVLTQPYFLNVVKAAKAAGKPVLLEADFCHPLYSWDKLREAERQAGVPRRHGDKYNYSPYVRDAAHAIDLADRIIVFSSHAYKSFIEYGVPEHKLALLRPPSPLKNPPLVSMPDFPRFVCTANHSVRKGSHLLTQAWDIFRRNYAQKAELVLIGHIEKSFRDTLHDQSVIKAGHASIPDIYHQYPGCFVLPSLLEGRPRAVLEAMACGMPAIVSEAATCDIVNTGENGWITAWNSTSIAESLMKMASQWDKAQDMGLRARDSVLAEHEGAYAQAVTQHIRELLQ